MPKFTYYQQKVVDGLQRELDDIERTWPMTEHYARIDPYISPYIQGGRYFEIIIYHKESKNWYDNAGADYILQHIFEHNLVKSDEVAFDVGCNAGTIAIAIASLAKDGHVYAFDPYPWNPVATRCNALLNGLQNVTSFPIGLSSSDAVLSVSPTESRSYEPLEDSSHKIQIKDFRRYTYLKPTLLKLDMEGAEHDLMEGADRASFSSVQSVILELHPIWLRPRGIDPAETLRRLQLFGFKLTAESAFGSPFNPADYQDHNHTFWARRAA